MAAWSQETRPLNSLSTYEVVLLLHALELGRYAEGFLALPMRGGEAAPVELVKHASFTAPRVLRASADLETATDADLQEAGMNGLALHRRTLLGQVARFRTEGVPTHLIESARAEAEAPRPRACP